MEAANIATTALSNRPKRADARRNYDSLLRAAHETFTAEGSSGSLEEIARRAGVGIGTLYRHFPTRAALVEAVYVDEVETLCQSAAGVAHLEPWDALVEWLHRFMGYIATKQALADELFSELGRDAEVFRSCHRAFSGAGEPLLERAQKAGVVREDVRFGDLVHLIGGIAKMPEREPGQAERAFRLAVDGLRRPQA